MLLDSCLSCCARSAPCKSVKISALRRKLWKSMLITASPPSSCHNSLSSATGTSFRKTFLGSPWRLGSSRRGGLNAHGVANQSCSYQAQVAATEPPHDDSDGAADLAADIDWAPLAHALLKHLTLAQMEALCAAVERALAGHSDCILVRERVVQLGRHEAVDLAQLVCQLWRWPDAPPAHPIVNFCDPEDAGKEAEAGCCINPYHWSLRLDPPAKTSVGKGGPLDSAPLDLSVSTGVTTLDSGAVVSDSRDDSKWPASTEDSALASSITQSSTEHFTSDLYSGHGPLSSSLHNNNNHGAPVWCSLSYWELLTHVGGRWFPVRSPSLHLVADFSPAPPPPLAALDLGALQARDPPARQLTAPVEADALRCVSRTRRRIGAGLVLARRGAVVWLHNRSPAPVFVSPQCRAGPLSSAAARRLPPGHALELFDLDLWTRCPRGVAGGLPLAPPGPVDPRVVHVSFGKGWGHNYKRQDITLCPCRLEILFHMPPYG